MHSLNLARTPMPTFLLPLNDANTTSPPTPPPPHTHTHTNHRRTKCWRSLFGRPVKRIRQKLPKNVQTLFFSATWTDPVALALTHARTRARTDTHQNTTQLKPHTPSLPAHLTLTHTLTR